MYAVRGFENILSDLKSHLPKNADTHEGSVFYDSIAPFAYELSKIYAMFDAAFAEVFADTADRDNLIRLCGERGVTAKPASRAVYSMLANTPQIPPGSIFSVGEFQLETVSYTNGYYVMSAVKYGTLGNRIPLFTPLIPGSYINGFSAAELISLEIPAEDEEDTESIRAKYFESIGSLAFGGNIADYVRETRKIAGVGAVKVIPCHSGGGTVKLILLDSEYNVPSAAVVNDVINYYGSEEGEGMAPIGHRVSVVPAAPFPVGVSAEITLKNGAAPDGVRDKITDVISGYFAEIRKNWGADVSTVRISRAMAEILDIDGVLDVPALFFNGEFANIVLAPDAVPVLGDVSYDF